MINILMYIENIVRGTEHLEFLSEYETKTRTKKYDFQK